MTTLGCSWRGTHPGCDISHPHTHSTSQPGPTPDDSSHEGTEPRYTMDEAVKILQQRLCEQRGHTFTVVTNASNDPTSLLCTACGRQGPVTWPED